MTTLQTYEAVRCVALALIAGEVVQAAGVSAGNGAVIDWRTVRSGEALQTDADAFDTAQFFVALVGPEAAMRGGGAPEVTAFMPNHEGSRRRAFSVRGILVCVEPHEDDALQAWFTQELAALAVSL